MNSYRCKREYEDPFGADIIFYEGETYYGYRESETGVYYVTNTVGDIDSLTVLPMYPFIHRMFHNHFITVAEIREMEIDKVLNIDIDVDI